MSSTKSEDAVIRLAGVENDSIVDGPGFRYAVYTQGCPHGCPGCHNPGTHDFAGGADVSVSVLLGEIDRNPLLTGVTLSGGEPFCQAAALLPLCREVKKRGLSIVAYSGYAFEELLALPDPAVRPLLALCDWLIDGRYIEAERDLSLRFRGGKNQRVIDVSPSLETGEAILLKIDE